MSIRGDVSAIADQIEEAANDAWDRVARDKAEAIEIEQHIARIISAAADIRDRIEDMFGEYEIPRGRV